MLAIIPLWFLATALMLVTEHVCAQAQSLPEDTRLRRTPGMTPDLVKRVGSGPSSPAKGNSPPATPWSPLSSLGSYYGSPKSINTQPPSPNADLSSIGSYQATPKSINSQPPSPQHGEEVRKTDLLSKPKRGSKWFSWWPKPTSITRIISGNRPKNPVHQRDPESRRRKTFFFGPEAKAWSKTVRPSHIMSPEVRQRREDRRLAYEARKKLNIGGGQKSP